MIFLATLIRSAFGFGGAYGMNGPPRVVNRLKGPRFLFCVHVGLVVISTLLLLKSAWR